jgi:flagellin
MPIQDIGGVGYSTSQKRTAGALNKTSRALQKILEQLSTAERINRASDDAAGLAISEVMRGQIRGLKMADQNVTDAMSALNIAEGSSQEIEDMLQRERELALQARSDTLNDEQRGMLDREYQNLQQEIDRVAQGTQFNTQNVTNGQGLAAGGAQIQVGPNAGDAVSLPSLDLSADNLGLSGVSIASSAGAADALEKLDTALNTVNAGRSATGAMINRFQATQNNLLTAATNTQAAESVLRDQDMAQALSSLTREQLLQEGGITAFQRFNEINSFHVLSLLQSP